jgi:HlyD family secretion protein
MAQRLKFAVGMTALLVAGAVVLSVAAGRRSSRAQDTAPSPTPLMVRGFTDAPAGETMIAGVGGDRVLELRVAEGQKVKRDQTIAVLSNYPVADIAVRSAEAALEQLEHLHESLVSGIQPTPKVNHAAGGKDKGKSKDSDSSKIGIAEQEAVVKLSTEENKLKVLQMQRSGLPAAQKELEISVSEQKLERDRAKLRVLKETLASDLAQNETDIRIQTAEVDRARMVREQALVHSPFDGIIVQILTRPGERIGLGIAQIVDMSQLRVLADVDEVLLGRVKLGSKVNVIFHGEARVHEGKVVRIAETVRRLPSMGSLGSGATHVRVVPIEVELDDPSQMPQMLGREAEVTFLEPARP